MKKVGRVSGGAEGERLNLAREVMQQPIVEAQAVVYLFVIDNFSAPQTSRTKNTGLGGRLK
jgi:hypothetical protein